MAVQTLCRGGGEEELSPPLGITVKRENLARVDRVAKPFGPFTFREETFEQIANCRVRVARRPLDEP